MDVEWSSTSEAGKFELNSLLGDDHGFDTVKPTRLIKTLVRSLTAHDKSDIVLDFFAGSGTSGQAVMELNAEDNGTRRIILIQLPEPVDPDNKDQKSAALFCDKIGKPRNIAEITKERLRRVGLRLREDNPMFAGDSGFRVFKLASSNIKAWDPDTGDLPKTLADSVEHLKTNRMEADILYELLLKLGLDLTVPMEERLISGKSVQSVGAGTLLACTAEKISASDVESLALGIVEWHNSLAPAGKTTIVFRDSAFENDVAKTNLTAILQQHGLENVRSL
jgi:adenine-specific DNA-methyltransferase